jgi:RNase P subunit RPR2
MAPLHSTRLKGGRLIKKCEALRREKVTAAMTKKTHVNSVPSHQSGRRVVDIDVLCRELWCTTCNVPLHLGNRLSEKRSGLNSCFEVPCLQCKSNFKVNTSRGREAGREGIGGPLLYDVNFKLAIGKFIQDH